MGRVPIKLELLSEYAHYYAQLSPDAEAVVTGAARCTYKDLANRVDTSARALLAAGVRKGDRVAVLSVPHNDFFVIFLAAGSIGAIYVGLNPRHTLNELQYVIADAEPAILLSRLQVGDRDYRGELAELGKTAGSNLQIVALGDDEADSPYPMLDEFLESGTKTSRRSLRDHRDSVKGSDPTLIVYTSGSTGRPKGAGISHYALIKCSRSQHRYWNASPIRMLNFLPINHIGCVGDIACFCLVGGGTIVFLEKFGVADSLRLLQDENVTIWAGVPTTLQMCVQDPAFGSFDLSGVQLIFWSGAAASRDLVEALQAITANLSTSYGTTETVGSVTFTDPYSGTDALAGTIGKPVRGYEVDIDSAVSRAGDDRQAGELLVRGDFIMDRYWRRPAATSHAIDKDGWLHTGDLAERLPDGSYRLIGRLKEMFKSGGYNVYPREIEIALEAHPGVALAAVVSVPDDLYQEVGVAFVESHAAYAVNPAELEEHCRQRIANYKVPKLIVVVDSLPRLPVGKIDKEALRKSADRLRRQRR